MIADDGLGVNILSLVGLDALKFEIDGSELFLKAGTELDFETTKTLDVTVRVDDPTAGGTPDDSYPLTIEVTEVDEEPAEPDLIAVEISFVSTRAPRFPAGSAFTIERH